jgi:phosphatidate cytidylyltransferase
MCCFACVPLQFGALAAGRLDLALTVLPIFAMLALPLLALAQGGTAQFVERAATRFWSVMAWVYCLSHVPALLLLGGPAFEARNAGLVAFVVALALSAQAVRSWRGLRSRSLLWPARAISMTAAGAMLSWMTPFTAPVAALLALAVALSAWTGVFVMAAMRHERKASLHDASALERLALRPDALVFAGPLFFYVVRVLLA